MTAEPTLDVILPYWGDPETLKKAVRSVLGQSDPHWRLLVVDDCYPDETVAEWFATLEDPRVEYLRNPANLGITGNFRRCLRLARADWVVFLGCDDLMLPDYVETVRRASRQADAAGIDIIQPGVVVIDEHDHVVRTLTDEAKRRLFAPHLQEPLVMGGEDLAVSLLRGNWLYWPSLAFRTSVVSKHDFLDGFPVVLDLGLIIDMVLEGSRLLVLPEQVFAYRRHAASASSTALVDGARFADERDYFRIAANRCERQGYSRAARAARRHLASRAYALTLVPQAVRLRSVPAMRMLMRHATGH